MNASESWTPDMEKIARSNQDIRNAFREPSAEKFEALKELSLECDSLFSGAIDRMAAGTFDESALIELELGVAEIINAAKADQADKEAPQWKKDLRAGFINFLSLAYADIPEFRAVRLTKEQFREDLELSREWARLGATSSGG